MLRCQGRTRTRTQGWEEEGGREETRGAQDTHTDHFIRYKRSAAFSSIYNKNRVFFSIIIIMISSSIIRVPFILRIKVRIKSFYNSEYN